MRMLSKVAFTLAVAAGAAAAADKFIPRVIPSCQAELAPICEAQADKELKAFCSALTPSIKKKVKPDAKAELSEHCKSQAVRECARYAELAPKPEGACEKLGLVE